MKQPKAPTRLQKEIIVANGLNPKDYAVVEYVSDFYMKVIHKDTGKIRIIDKNRRSKSLCRR